MFSEKKSTESFDSSAIYAKNFSGSQVDAFVDEKMDGQVPSVLSIDTGGWEVLALLGAARTLSNSKLHYVEFEYHNVGMWKRFELQPIVDYMYNLGFDCFWTSHNGELLRLSGCSFDKVDCRSNIVCSRRDTLWNSVMSSAETNHSSSFSRVEHQLADSHPGLWSKPLVLSRRVTGRPEVKVSLSVLDLDGSISQHMS